MTLLATTSIAVLRHINGCGSATREDVTATNIVTNPAVRLSTLVRQGFLTTDRSTRPTRYQVTAKGTAVLANPTRSSPRKGTGTSPSSRAPTQSLGNQYRTPALREASGDVDPDAYQGDELRPFTGRPGAMDAFTKPSLVNGEAVTRTRPILMGAKPTPRPGSIERTL